MNKNPSIALWLFAVSLLIVLMVAMGGWVRLTHSGLSMVEWHVVTGVVPPLSEQAWEDAFQRYQLTPEYVQINHGINLAEYRFIYYMEWGHRLLGRLTGLAFVIPLGLFGLRHAIPRHRLAAFAAIALLFALQGLLGWLMVMSGLVDQPRVSHLRLTLHLTAALVLLAACLWLAFGYAFGQPNPTQPRVSPQLKRLSLLLLAVVAVQIIGGGLVAGLRAGLVADTFPRLLGEWIPGGLWRLEPFWINHLDNPLTVHFQHRWFAFVVVFFAVALERRARHELVPSYLGGATKATLHLTLLQIVLGIGLVVMHVPAWMASIHQIIAVGILAAALLTCHRAHRA